MTDVERTFFLLRERVKELTALHSTARILQNHRRPLEELLRDVVELLPLAWQFPDAAGARIVCRGHSAATKNFVSNTWCQRAEFEIEGWPAGTVEVSYCKPCPSAAEGPFLAEERALIDSIAEMLRAHVQHRIADEAVNDARKNLEQQVRDRTAELELANEELRRQINEQLRNERRISDYQRQLQRLATELALTEASERREIASDLHEHIGQALAFISLRLSELRGNAVFCGFEDTLSDLMELLEQTIAYTRDLTVQISPPVLYEFGLAAAVSWKAAQIEKKTGLKIHVHRDHYQAQPSVEIAVSLFKSISELLANVVKHARSEAAHVRLVGGSNEIQIQVEDQGCGFEFNHNGLTVLDGNRFGLFSIQERVRSLGGTFTVESKIGRGTSVVVRVPLGERALT